jgi:outer membrane immunogenic protein
MKKVLLTSVAALALSAGSAFAADLPSKKAPVFAPPPPVLTWTGFYVGLNAGASFSESNRVYAANPAGLVLANINAGVAPAFLSTSSNVGFIGGGQLGYNMQLADKFIVGLETDIQGLTNSNTTVAQTWGANAFTVSRGIDYLGTVRGRVGFLFTPTLLVYGTGGLAYGGVNVSSSWQGLAASSFSDTRVGWTAGGGVEWMFAPHWSAKAEYLYYDLGSVTGPFAGTAVDFSRSRARFDGHIARLGVNYHFNFGAPAPVVAKY